MTLLLGYKKQMVEEKYDIDQLMILAQQKVEATTAGSTVLKTATTRIPSLMHTGTSTCMAWIRSISGGFLAKEALASFVKWPKVELDDDVESTATTVIELSNSSRTYPGYELFMKDYNTNGFASSTTAAGARKQQQQQPIIEGHLFGKSNHTQPKKRDTVQDREFIAQNYRRRDTTTTVTRFGRRSGKVKARYAIKRVKDSCIESGEQFINGVIDLAIEAKFLSVLRHPNIIKMRATAMTDPFSPDDPYFIVLDKLDDILSKRLVKWSAREDSIIRKLQCQSYKVEQAFYIERIKVAHDVANALKYLHSRHVLYRDIKPENIGFDVRGDVKIFDFGLAKEVNPNFASDDDGTYQLTAMTGSLRYMAPEVMLGRRYNESADVYSVSILLWQLLSLKTPYGHYYDVETFKERMAHLGKRPSIDGSWNREIRDLLQLGWSAHITDRPTMGHVSLTLKYELDRYGMEETIDFVKPFDLHQDTDEIDDDDVSRKSEISYMRLAGRAGETTSSTTCPLSMLGPDGHNVTISAGVSPATARRRRC